MLPPMLAEVKQKLEDKGYAHRSEREDTLLEELTNLDKLFEQDSTLRKSAAFKESRIVSGPRGTCSCCGK
jgi:hypothetical protein